MPSDEPPRTGPGCKNVLLEEPSKPRYHSFRRRRARAASVAVSEILGDFSVVALLVLCGQVLERFLLCVCLPHRAHLPSEIPISLRSPA